MKALDTNTLVRFLVGDDESMKATVDAVLEDASQRGETLYVTGYVFLETLWVLRAVYKYSRQDILDAMEALTMMPVLEFDSACPIRELFEIARKTTFDLADILIGLAARERGCETTLTLDKKAAQSELFEEIQ